MSELLRKVIKKHIKLVVGVVILIVIYSLLSVLSGYSLSFMVNIFENNNHNLKDVFRIILIILMIDLLSLTSLYIKYFYQSKLQSELRNDIRIEISNKLINQDYQNFDKNDSGTYLAWFTNDIKEIDNRCFEGFFNIIHSIASVIGTFIAISTFNIWISIATALLSVFMVFLPNIMNDKLQKKGDKYTLEEEVYISKTKSLIEGFPDLYFSNNEIYFDSKLKEYNNIYELNYFQFLIVQLKSAVYSAGLSSFSQLCLLGMTMIFVSLGKAPIGSILAMAGLGQVFMGGVSGIVNSVILIKSSNVFFKKYKNIEVRDHRILNNENINNEFAIKTEDLNFSYNDESKNINYPNLTIKSVNKTLIKGDNGSGKSTLLHLILGLYKPTRGTVKYNNINISEIKKEKLFDRIAYMHQSPNLFMDTIRNNIKLDSNIDDFEIWQVLKDVGLDDFIENLPGKLDYMISDYGKNLSGGQKQRIILARHLLRNVDMIILDEATSNMDSISKSYLEDNIFSRKDLGVIIVDHNLNKEKEILFDEVITIK